MSVWSPQQIYKIWQVNGGAMAHGIVAVAVALAESGGNDHAISPSSDYGLWQINVVNFRSFGLDTQTALDPNRNARVAISMSRNGTEWGPWCTCWQNPDANCGHLGLSVPQPGTPAANQIPRVTALLGGIPLPTTKPDVPGGAAGAHNGWGALTHFVGLGAQAQHKGFHDLIKATGRIVGR